MLKDNKHEFALFYSDLSLQKKSEVISINDAALVTRIISVLRLKPQDNLILFDQTLHVKAVLKNCSKKSCSFTVTEWHKNKELKPHITVLLPLLKRDAIESALFSCTALGATTVQLVHTEKTRKWQGEKELNRLQRIVVSAAEQSKNFAFPNIQIPVELAKSLELYAASTNKVFADPEGLKFSEVMKKSDIQKEFLLFVGPEGDLTSTEKKMLEDQFTFCKLTSTILKSEQALALMLGAVRMTT